MRNFQFMVDFTLPEKLSEEFISLIPIQKQFVNRFLTDGKLLTYALSLETQKLWAIFSGKSEVEVLEMVSRLPLTQYMKVHISELSSYSTVSAVPTTPVFSVN